MLLVCDEAGPTGFGLARQLGTLRVACCGHRRRLDRLAVRVRHQLDPWDFAGRQALVREVLDHMEATPDALTLFWAIPLPPEGSPPSAPPVSSQLRLRQHRGATVPFPERPDVCGRRVPPAARTDPGVGLRLATGALPLQLSRTPSAAGAGTVPGGVSRPGGAAHGAAAHLHHCRGIQVLWRDAQRRYFAVPAAYRPAVRVILEALALTERDDLHHGTGPGRSALNSLDRCA